MTWLGLAWASLAWALLLTVACWPLVRTVRRRRRARRFWRENGFAPWINGGRR